MSTASKSPYEIRLDLLKLAYDILLQKEKAKTVITESLSGSCKLENFMKNSPTTEEIIAEAEKLNKFVSKTQ